MFNKEVLQYRRETYDVNRIVGTITLRHLSGTTILREEDDAHY